MQRKRRSNRSAHSEQLDQAVMMFVHPVAGDSYCTVTLRTALGMVASGEAETVTVESECNGSFTAYRRLHAPGQQGKPSPAALTTKTAEAASKTPKDRLSRRERAELVRLRIWPAMRSRMSADDWRSVDRLAGAQR